MSRPASSQHTIVSRHSWLPKLREFSSPNFVDDYSRIPLALNNHSEQTVCDKYFVLAGGSEGLLGSKGKLVVNWDSRQFLGIY